MRSERVLKYPKNSYLWQHCCPLFRKLELGEVTREMNANEDFLANVKDANVKEIIAKVGLSDI